MYLAQVYGELFYLVMIIITTVAITELFINKRDELFPVQCRNLVLHIMCIGRFRHVHFDDLLIDDMPTIRSQGRYLLWITDKNR